DAPVPVPKGRPTAPPVSRAPKPQTPVPAPVAPPKKGGNPSSDEFPEFDDDMLSDPVDLTGDDNIISSDSVEVFGNDVSLLWREDYASRPEPLPRGGRKRKSDEISRGPAEDDDGEFPDLYELMGAAGSSCETTGRRPMSPPESASRRPPNDRAE